MAGKYSNIQKRRIRELRARGCTYTEIQSTIGAAIPKASLAYICKDITLTVVQKARIEALMSQNRIKARQAAVAANKRLFDAKVAALRDKNANTATYMQDGSVQRIALAMLYLGEGAKWQTSRAPKLASTNPKIITIYIQLLDACFGVNVTELRARVQHRADQDSAELVAYWSGITGIAVDRFYPSYIDKRTIGRPTTKSNYKGVCTVMSRGYQYSA